MEPMTPAASPEMTASHVIAILEMMVRRCIIGISEYMVRLTDSESRENVADYLRWYSGMATRLLDLAQRIVYGLGNSVDAMCVDELRKIVETGYLWNSSSWGVPDGPRLDHGRYGHVMLGAARQLLRIAEQKMAAAAAAKDGTP